MIVALTQEITVRNHDSLFNDAMSRFTNSKSSVKIFRVVKIFEGGSLFLKYTLVIKHAISQDAMISGIIFG